MTGTLDLLETTFQAVDGQAEICVDHFEAGDAETLANGGGPLHLHLTGILIDFERAAVLDEDIAEATVSLSLSVAEAQQLITALTQGIQKARALAPKLTHAQEAFEAGVRG